MGYVIAGQTISLDGYVADANGSAEPLYPDLEALQGSAYMNALIEEAGAVIMGRRSFEMPEDPDSLADSYEFQTPIFVVTHHPPSVTPKENDRLTFTFVTEGVESAVAQATAAAGEKAVMVVGGVDVIRQLLHAGLVDELRVDVMPVLLGAGLRFLDDPSLAHVDLEKIGIEQVGVRTSLRFRVVRG
ncbi:MAG: dihydrofolate reductase family protein [Actinomycetota bacterium]